MINFELQNTLSLGSSQNIAVATCCTFNHNGQLLVAGCSDGVIRIFDLRRSDCIDSWTAHQGETLDIQLTADFTNCCTLGQDGKV
jgi:FOG: WD40 repeat